MPQTLTSLTAHIIYSTKDRQPLLAPDLKPALAAYMAGVIENVGGKAILINGGDDHLHVLMHFRVTHALADIVRDMKANSSRWVHETYPALASFAWQRGYGAFTVSRSNVAMVYEYIARQEEHHKRESFQDEYRKFLIRHGIEFDERYVWD